MKRKEAMKSKFYLMSILILALIVTSCGTSSPEVAEQAPVTAQVNASPEQTITIGIVGDDPAEEIETFQPMAEYLTQKLVDQNILAGNVIVVAAQDEMDAKLKSGEVDLFFETGFGAVQAYENAGAIPLVRRWKKGVSEYYSVIVSMNSGGINRLSNLNGKMVAFKDPGSTSGYIMPKAMFIDQGYTLTEKTDANSPVEAEEVGYFFAGGQEENAFALLLAGRVDAVAFQYEDYIDFPAAQVDQTKIIAETPAVPRQIVLASPELDPAVRDAIINILLDMENTDEGLALLASFENTTRFDLFPPLGPEKAMEDLVKLFSSVE
jgi:phosphonate transport system substrate-binding protein